MRNSLSLFVLALSLTAVSLVYAEDSLFSDVPVESVYGDPNAPAPGTRQVSSSAPAPSRLIGVAALSDTLRKAGFDPKELDSQTVSITVTHEQWNFPAAVAVTADQNQIELVVMLSTVKDEKQAPAERLLSLLAANKDLAPAYFAYSPKRRQTELHRVVPNQGVNGELLKDALTGLASIAKQTQSVWSFETAVAAAPATTQPVTTNPVAANPPAASAPAAGSGNVAPPAANTAPASSTSVASLVGKWAASVSTKEAFAIQLGNDSNFVLAHVKDGKQTRSNGTFALSGQQLTLTGSDGTKLTGMVNVPSEQEFQFIPNSNTKGTILVFKKAK